MTATARSVVLRAIAQGVADALPLAVEEVVLTGSVSRGVADDISDIGEQLALVEQMVDDASRNRLGPRAGSAKPPPSGLRPSTLPASPDGFAAPAQGQGYSRTLYTRDVHSAKMRLPARSAGVILTEWRATAIVATSDLRS
jgi:hypothetical protein